MDRQKTIAKQVTFSGAGLHTGNLTNVTFKPALPNSGIKFVWNDVKNRHVVIPAIYKNVLGVVRGTTIGTDNVAICTVEHLLSALCGLGIDNIEIELDNNELPIFDGSASYFVNYLIEANIVEQKYKRKYITLGEPVIYKAKDKEHLVEIIAYPADELSIDCTIRYDHPVVSEQRFSIKVTSNNFINEIASAKTFCFDYEIETLKKQGLARGGKLENVIVIGIDRVHNEDKLKYKDEFVRHKILDLLGDIYLLGHPLKAHVVAYKCGHIHNINFARKIAEENRMKNG